MASEPLICLSHQEKREIARHHALLVEVSITTYEELKPKLSILNLTGEEKLDIRGCHQPIPDYEKVSRANNLVSLTNEL